MPYGGEKTPGQLAKMERCVRGRMKEGHSKESAIRICKSSILGGKNGKGS